MVRAVAKMTEVDLAQEPVLDLGGKFIVDRQCVDIVIEPLRDLVEDAFDRVVSIRADAGDVILACGHIELRDGKSSAILAAVVLLLHHQVRAA
jgi:hypothetical protein